MNGFSGCIGGYRGGFVKSPHWLHIAHLGLVGHDGGDRQGKSAQGEKAGQDHLDDAGFFHAEDVQHAEQDEYQHGKKHFAHGDAESGDGVAEAELEDVGAAVEAVDDKADGGGVHGHVGKVGSDEEPAAQVGEGFSEGIFGEGKFAAGFGIFG